MKTPKGKEVFVFDNEGKSFDRFTVVTDDGSLFGASTQPFHPQGFGQFCGEVQTQNSITVDVYIGNARNEPGWLGKEITAFSDLPEDVQKYVEQVSE